MCPFGMYENLGNGRLIKCCDKWQLVGWLLHASMLVHHTHAPFDTQRFCHSGGTRARLSQYSCDVGILGMPLVECINPQCTCAIELQ